MLKKICEHCGNTFYKKDQSKHCKWKLRRFCSKSCSTTYTNTGRKMPPHFGVLMSEKLKGREITWADKIGKATTKWQTGRTGKLANHWQGGKTPELKRLRNSAKYAEWRKKVFDRDDYTCQVCFARGGYLEADHIKPFAHYPESRFDISNGRTLCKPCHIETDTYAYKSRKDLKC